MRWLLLAALGGLAGWFCFQAGPDPRGWPAVARREVDRMSAAGAEALEAGRAAAADYEERMARRLATAAGRGAEGAS